MNKILTFFLVMLTIGLSAQVSNTVDVKNNDLKKPYERYLRYDIDNNLTVTVPGYKSSDLKVVVNDGVVTGAGDNKIIKMNKVDKTVLSVISLKPQPDTLRKINYKVVGAPDPAPSVASKTGGEITLNEVITAGGVKALDNGPFINSTEWKVVGFSLSFISGMFVDELPSTSDKFTPEQINAINGIKPGQKFFFENVRVITADSTVRNIGGVFFKMK